MEWQCEEVDKRFPGNSQRRHVKQQYSGFRIWTQEPDCPVSNKVPNLGC